FRALPTLIVLVPPSTAKHYLRGGSIIAGLVGWRSYSTEILPNDVNQYDTSAYAKSGVTHRAGSPVPSPLHLFELPNAAAELTGEVPLKALIDLGGRLGVAD